MVIFSACLVLASGKVVRSRIDKAGGLAIMKNFYLTQKNNFEKIRRYSSYALGWIKNYFFLKFFRDKLNL